MLFDQNRQIYFPDTSTLLAAWDERYPQDIFPDVWQFMDSLDGRLRICEEVRNEIKRHTPELLDWLDNSSTDTRLSLVELDRNMADTVQHHIQRIVAGWPRWRAVRSRDSAEPWVIAYAQAFGGTVVSEEQQGGGSVKIPYVCDELDVRHMNLLELFRAEGFRSA